MVVTELVARPGHADEVGEREQLVDPAPGQDLGQRVGAGDEEQLGVRVRGVQIASVSAVYVGPPRSMSTRLTENRGLEAVATTVIR